MDTSCSTFSEILRQPLLAEVLLKHLTWKDLINIGNTNSICQQAIYTYVSHLKTIDLNSPEVMALDDPRIIMDCTRNLRKLSVKTIMKKANGSKGKLSVTDLVDVINRNELLVELEDLRMDLIPLVGDSLKNIHKLSLCQSDDEVYYKYSDTKFLGYCKSLYDSCKSLHELVEINVGPHNLTDEQFGLICKLPMKKLALFFVDFEVKDFDSCFSNCPQLESIEMFECSGDRNILSAIASKCGNLTAFQYYQYNVPSDHNEAILSKWFTRIIRSNPKISVFRATMEEEITTCNSTTMDAMVHNLQALQQFSVNLYERNLLATQPNFFRLVNKFSMLKKIDISCYYFPQKWLDHIAKSCSSLDDFGLYDTDDSSMQFPEENIQTENQQEQNAEENQPEQNAEESQQEENAEENQQEENDEENREDQNADRGIEKKRRLRREKRRRQRMKIKEQNRKKQNGEENLPQQNSEEQEAIERKRQARREKRRRQRRRRRERNKQEQDTQEYSHQRNFPGNRRELNAEEKKRQKRREKRRRQRKRRRERNQQERNGEDENLPQQNAEDDNPREQNVEDVSNEIRSNELNVAKLLTNLKFLRCHIGRCLSKTSFEAISSSPCLEDVEMRVQRNAATDEGIKLLDENFEVISDNRRSSTWFVAVELKRRSVST